MSVIILLAHGSPDPRHRADLDELARRVGEQSGLMVQTAYLGHHPPTALEAARGADEVTLVPAFIARGYHVRVDLPPVLRQLGAAGVRVRLTDVLGDDARVPSGALMARGVLWDRAVRQGSLPLVLSRSDLGRDLVLDRCAAVID